MNKPLQYIHIDVQDFLQTNMKAVQHSLARDG